MSAQHEHKWSSNNFLSAPLSPKYLPRPIDNAQTLPCCSSPRAQQARAFCSGSSGEGWTDDGGGDSPFIVQFISVCSFVGLSQCQHAWFSVFPCFPVSFLVCSSISLCWLLSSVLTTPPLIHMHKTRHLKWVFCPFPRLCSHHLSLVPEHFYHSKRTAWTH